jgi:hypothetical protein
MKDIEDTIKGVLEDNFWPPSLEVRVAYARTHDDCDGDLSQQLVVGILQDGDVWVQTEGHTALRFRMPMIGGGLSHRTRNALLVLR